MYNSIKPGEVWLDTKGERIQAHGGSVLYFEGKYYWYGENKEGITGKTPFWHAGIRCYSSTDLYNWTDEGVIIKPDLEDETSPLHPTAFLDRPHIIYNKETKKFVCWIKVMNKGGKMVILTSDNILGPYEIVDRWHKCVGMNVGDFDLATAPDGKAYCYFERPHSELICADLTEDYTSTTGYYSTHFPLPCPPYVREAPAHFIRNRKHYLITSGTTGYLPNPSEVAVSDTWHGPFKVLGNPHPTDDTNTSFHSQVSSVFKVEGKKDLYIAVADRWVPDHMDFEYEEYSGYYKDAFSGDPVLKEKADKNLFGKMGSDKSRNTSLANYVWLPLRFDGEMVYIDWHDEWKIEDYE